MRLQDKPNKIQMVISTFCKKKSFYESYSVCYLLLIDHF